MTTQSEQKLENNLITQLEGLGFVGIDKKYISKNIQSDIVEII